MTEIMNDLRRDLQAALPRCFEVHPPVMESMLDAERIDVSACIEGKVWISGLEHHKGWDADTTESLRRAKVQSLLTAIEQHLTLWLEDIREARDG